MELQAWLSERVLRQKTGASGVTLALELGATRDSQTVTRPGSKQRAVARDVEASESFQDGKAAGSRP